MVSIATGASACQTPRRSRISRLAYDRTIGRKGAAGAFSERIRTSLPKRRNANAAAQPTGPAPLTRRSIPSAGIAHQRLDAGNRLGRFGGQHFAAGVGDQHVVL